MALTDKEIHLVRVEQILCTLNDAIKTDCKRLLNSGMINLDDYSTDNYQLAKVVIDAAIERNAGIFNSHAQKREVENLVKM